MALDVKVKIELSKAAGKVGFGIPLLLKVGAAQAVDYTECYGIDDVIAAGFAEGTDMYAAANMVFTQANRPDKIAICVSTETAAAAVKAVASEGWRQLVVVGGDYAETVALADYIETTRDKMLFVSIPREAWADFKADIAAKAYDRTVIFVNDTPYADAALVGETAGRTAGSFTYKFKTLKGVAAETFTDAEIDALHKDGAICYVTKAGDDITSEGISHSGKYIDITDSIDYVIQNIEYRIQKTFNNMAKVNFDDRGIALLEAQVKLALLDAYNNGIIAVSADGVTPDYSVYFAPRSATTEAERATREYKWGTFSFALAGAIHTCIVTGTVTY